MSLEEGQQPSSLGRKRSFNAAFGPSQVILDSLLPRVSTFVQGAANYWQHYCTSITRFVNDRLERWQDAAQEVEKAVPSTSKRRKSKSRETEEQKAARRASRRSTRRNNVQQLQGPGDPDSPSVRRDDKFKVNAATKRETVKHFVANLGAQVSIPQFYNPSPPINRPPRRSVRQQYADLMERRNRSSLNGMISSKANSSPMYRGLFAASLQAKQPKSSALGARTAKDAANVLNRMTPYKPRIAKQNGAKKSSSGLPFTASNLAQYLESPTQASPDVVYRSPGAPLPSPVASFNPFKTKDSNNRLKAKTDEQSLEDLIAELRREHPHQYEWQKIDKEKEARNIEIAKKRGLYQPARAPIPIDTLKKVEKSFHGQLAYDHILVDKFNQEIKVKDLSTLKTTAWLNDEVINFYMNLISERAKASNIKLHAFNTFFYTKLEKGGYKDVRRWAKKAKVDIAQCDMILVPVHLGVHWCMSVINLRDKRFEYWDSLKGGAGQAFRALREYMANEAPSIDISSWKDHIPDNGPRQRNGYDCGVFACQTAESVSRSAEPSFNQDDMPELRKRMAASILDAKLY